MTRALTDQERMVLERAGLDDTVIADFDALARQTPWLTVHRWMWRAHNPHALLIGAVLLGFAISVWANPAWFFTIAAGLYVLPHLISGAWRMATGAIAPQALGARTAIALSVRAKPDDMGGAGAAFAQLKLLASVAHGRKGADALEALNRYQREKDRYQLIALLIGLTLGGLMLTAYFSMA